MTEPAASSTAARPTVGASSCLLGQQVRFDGGHKRDAFVADSLGTCFDLRPFCPEAAIGLGIPRAAIRLTGALDAPRAVGVRDPSLDVTARLAGYADTVTAATPDLCGYILKKGSPSCGMERVKVHGESGRPPGKGRGIFAARLMQARPLLPVEEEGRLNDAGLRESFVERVYTIQRWKALTSAGLTAAALVAFHTRHKLLLLSHCEVEYRALGALVASAGRGDLSIRADRYVAGLMRGLSQPTTRRRHANVLQHLLGYLRGKLEAQARHELAAMIDEYREGQVPLVVPIRFLKHHFARHPDAYVALQYYLEPYPQHLGLRNHL